MYGSDYDLIKLLATRLGGKHIARLAQRRFCEVFLGSCSFIEGRVKAPHMPPVRFLSNRDVGITCGGTEIYEKFAKIRQCVILPVLTKRMDLEGVLNEEINL